VLQCLNVRVVTEPPVPVAPADPARLDLDDDPVARDRGITNVF